MASSPGGASAPSTISRRTSPGWCAGRGRPARRRRRRPAATPAAASCRDGRPDRRRAGTAHGAEESSAERGHAGRLVGVDGRLHQRVQVAVQHGVEVVGLVAGAVVGDAVLGEVVGADPLRAVDGADLRPARRGRRLRRPPPGRSGAAGRAARASPTPCSGAGTSRSGRTTTVPVGRCVMRTAESVVLTLCPPGPERAVDVDLQVVRVDGDLDLVGLGHHEDAGGRGVDAALALGDGHALDAVHPALVLQPRPRRVARLRHALGLARPPGRPCSRRGRTRSRR